MVLTLAIPLRVIYGLQDFITMRHLENMGKVMLVTGLIVGYGYVMEAFFGCYSANQYEGFMICEPDDRPVRAGLLGADLLQHHHARSSCGSRASGPARSCCSRSRWS